MIDTDFILMATVLFFKAVVLKLPWVVQSFRIFKTIAFLPTDTYTHFAVNEISGSLKVPWGPK